MSLRKAVPWVVSGIVVIALIEALLVIIPVVRGLVMKALLTMFPTMIETYQVLYYRWGFAVCLAILFTFLGWRGWCAIDRRVGEELEDEDKNEREYIFPAWLAGLSGFLLMGIEAISDWFKLLGNNSFNVQFAFEDLLLGVSALCMLAEQVSILNIKAGKPKDGPGPGRIITP